MSFDLGTAALLPLMLAFGLGVRHGFDADHLVAIDSLTRLHFQRYPLLARFSGLFFSLGHGLVVLLIATTTSLLRRHWSAPDWLALAGNGLSVGFLLLLGLANLRQVLVVAPRQPGGSEPPPPPWLMAGLTRHLRHPSAALLVGALFAISYDTVGQAVLFGSSALAGPASADPVLLALAFLLGMLCVDGSAGWWMSALLTRNQGHADHAGRTLGLTVALMSLGMAGLGMARQFSSAVDDWAQGSGLALSLGSVLLLASSFVYARWARRATPSPQEPAPP